jgi:Ni,Fe-hydrogenase I cytochrome b subunit
MANTDSEKYTPFHVWDAPTRWFHWINALAVFGLIANRLCPDTELHLEVRLGISR